MVSSDKEHSLLYPLLIQGDMRWRSRVKLRKPGYHLCPETAQISLRGDFIAELLGHIGGNCIVHSIQHALMPRIVFAKDKNLEQKKILDRQQEPGLQGTTLMSEKKIRMED